MKLLALFLPLLVATAVADNDFDLSSSTSIFIQAIGSPSNPITPLVTIRYSPLDLSAAIESYEAPEFSPDSNDGRVRLGIYSPASKSWASSTTVTSVETFAQGYAPIFILSLSINGDVLSATAKSGRVDAGQTRGFGPKVKVVKMSSGTTPELNRPVVLSPEGKVAEPEPEKTLLQKYWWVGLGVLMLVVTAGGDK